MNELRTLCYAVLQCWTLQPGRSTGELKLTPLNLFMNIIRGSEILRKGLNSLPLDKYSHGQDPEDCLIRSDWQETKHGSRKC